MKTLTCKNCGKVVDNFEVVNYEDLTGWCTSECWLVWGEKEAERLKANEDDLKRRGITIVR